MVSGAGSLESLLLLLLQPSLSYVSHLEEFFQPDEQYIIKLNEIFNMQKKDVILTSKKDSLSF